MRLSCKVIKWEREFKMVKHKTMHSKKKKSNITHKRMGSELIIATTVERSWGYDGVIKMEVQSSVKLKSQKNKQLRITGREIENTTENTVYICLENCMSSLHISKIILIKLEKGHKRATKAFSGLKW